MNRLSFGRFLAVLHKEWIQVRRDPMTLRLIIALPVMQLFLFGYAINTDPKHLPTGLLAPDHSQYVRTVVAALRNSGYYDIRPLASEAAAERALAEGEYAEAVINLDSLMITSVRWKIPAEDLCRCNLTVLATAIYCTWVEKMTDVVALPKPKFTSHRGA